MKYLAIIHGGEGPDVWDKEIRIDAADFSDAAAQAVAKAKDHYGEVYSLEECYESPSGTPICSKCNDTGKRWDGDPCAGTEGLIQCECREVR